MSQAMLTLDGEPIIMKSMRVSVSMQFQDKDQSGQTSSTSSAEQGAKGKELDISGLIAFKDDHMLSRLFELADAKGKGGQRHIYRVGSLLAKSVKVRQAKFAGRISASEQEGLLAWVVQFTLKEFDSVPEKREARLPGKPANIGTGSPGTTAAAGGSSQPGEETLSSGEAFFKQLDNKLGDVLA
ncbi:baseplate complex protein [Aeromonas rivuli]|jgi:hypothetical protein|uniref:baseplate complex protein n=1 Tax=Aeromonas rivuli TaxID=648794 RepID=UPI0005A65FE0|nr:hypothetical protein [Aeromonas rivuli]